MARFRRDAHVEAFSVKRLLATIAARDAVIERLGELIRWLVKQFRLTSLIELRAGNDTFAEESRQNAAAVLEIIAAKD